MSSDREMTRIVRSWLEEGTNVLPDRVLDRVLDQLPATPQRRRPWWQAWRYPFMSNTLKVATAGAAGLLVVLLGIGMYFNQTGGVGGPGPSPSPAPSPTVAPTAAPTPEPTAEAATPVEIAQAYIEARNAYDPERAGQLVADNFTTTEPPDGFIFRRDMELAFESHNAWGFNYALGDCRERERTTSTELMVVECDSLWTTEVHLRGGHAPTAVRFVFRIRDGRITSVTHGASSDGWFFGPGSFYDGFLAEHVDFRGLVDTSFNLEPEATREVIERLPEYFDLYEEWLSEQSPAPSP